MDDLIRRFRDYQIEWLTAHNDIEFCEEEEKLIIGFLKDTAESFMRENPSAQQWIPCSERLPEEFKRVLCCTDMREMFLACVYIFDDGNYSFDDEDGMMWEGNVVAWMPLPEPYKEDDDG